MESTQDGTDEQERDEERNVQPRGDGIAKKDGRNDEDKIDETIIPPAPYVTHFVYCCNR
jgi:hypothetical protein